MQKMMKILIIILMCGTINAQNLVQNPSFEFYSSCPTDSEQIDRANNWNRPPNATGTPDYFNACNTQYHGVPDNINGNQQAFEGNAFSGIVIYYEGSDLTSNYREYIETQLLSPLIAGESYQLSFYVSLADNIRFASNNIGAFFSVNQLLGNGNAQPINLTPHILNQEIVLSSTSWTHITGTYVATGNENYLTIGNFFSNDETQIQLANPNWGFPASYYYIDNVSVTQTLGLEDFIEEYITIFPNPSSSLIFLNSNHLNISKIQVINSFGQKVKTIDDNFETINISNLSSGIYILQIDTEYGIIRKKIIKE